MNAQVGEVDGSLTENGGLLLVAEPAVVQLTGEDHPVGFDRLRADRVGEGLLSAPVPPSAGARFMASTITVRVVP